MKGRGGPFAARTGYAPHSPAGHFVVPAPSPRVMHKRGGVGVGRKAGGYPPARDWEKWENRHLARMSGVNCTITILKSGVNYTILWIKTT